MEQTPACAPELQPGRNEPRLAESRHLQNHHRERGARPELQATVGSTLEVLERSIADKIISRNTVTDFLGDGTGCVITEVVDLGSRGSVGVTIGNVESAATCTASPTTRRSAALSTMRGIRICNLRHRLPEDDPAKVSGTSSDRTG
jgi:hypothetical protein